ncbi:MAG: sulfate transporter [Bacteroidetes bacterium B1(2017)]|nr:MAG: sulfate transporter [Bacteroidetes bacterium B1(2017)]
MNKLIAPADGLAGLKKHWKDDLLSGFIISLIALPLCLGIAMASGVPPMAGIIAGIIGGLFVSLSSGSHLTINGPAAGLAVIVLMSMEGFKKMAPAGLTPEQVEMFAYQCTLGVGIGCGILQLMFGFVKAGFISNFFPSSVVHGMLAAIGIMIFSKQIHTAVGVKPEGKEMLEIIMEIPHSIMNMNPDVALIALISIAILIGLPKVKNKYVKMLPAPLIVIMVAIPLGHYFDLETVHKYLFLNGHEYTLGPKFLVNIPANIMDGIVMPRFDFLFTGFGIQMMITYSLVASLESLLTAKAIDKMDPYKRESNYNRELFAKGSGNILSSLIGGLPIIAEVVRSSANVNNGAKTRWANFFHGAFLLIFVVFLGDIIHQIPLSALAAMLMVTGYRLASPGEFAKTLKVGKEQLTIFITTIVFTLATDLLIGIAAGILAKLIIHAINGVPLKSLFKPFFTMVIEDDDHYMIDVEHSAIFSNFMSLKKHLEGLPPGKKITLDFSETKLVDHSVREHLHDLELAYERTGGEFIIVGLDDHTSLSDHPHSTVKK